MIIVGGATATGKSHLAIELAKSDYFVVIVGKPDHPEVIAIKANAEQYSNRVIVGTTIEEISRFENEIKAHKKVGVVVQTTQMLSTLNTVINYALYEIGLDSVKAKCFKENRPSSNMPSVKAIILPSSG